MKRCRKCGEVLETAAFPRNRHCADGLSSWCKGCHARATREWRARVRASESMNQEEPVTREEMLRHAKHVRQLNSAERKLVRLTAKVDAGHAHLAKPRDKAAEKLATLPRRQVPLPGPRLDLPRAAARAGPLPSHLSQGVEPGSLGDPRRLTVSQLRLAKISACVLAALDCRRWA